MSGSYYPENPDGGVPDDARSTQEPPVRLKGAVVTPQERAEHDDPRADREHGPGGSPWEADGLQHD